MRNKVILVLLIAFVTIVFAMSAVFASSSGDFVTIDKVRVNGIAVSEGNITAAGDISETVPVEVYFTANRDASKVRVKVYLEDGFKDEIYDRTDRFHVVEGSSYAKRFSLKLPSTMDLEDLRQEISLYVQFTAEGEDQVEADYPIEMQRQEFGLNILSIDAPDRVLSGSTIAVDVVLQNNGDERLDNTYVKASIPELGIERKLWFGDLNPTEENDTEEIPDVITKKIYLTVPRNAVPGTYNIEIEAYNYDTSTTAKQKIVVSGIETGALSAVTSKKIAVGEETSFEVVLINPNDRMVVYSITPEEAKGLLVDVEEPISAVSADSSKTVKVNVKASESAEEGTHVVTVDVNSEAGLVKQVSFSVNVEKKTTASVTTASPVFILTIVLVVIFVVLLIVLIVLLSRKPSEPEEFGETSYY